MDTVPCEVFSPQFDDSDWRTVRIPHDWGIEGEFDENNDISITQIKEDGIKVPIRHTGRTGALPIIGAGVYRKWITVQSAERVFLELDGVMRQSKVYCNGVEVGGCHFGYKSYEVELTDAVKFGEKNLIAIYAVVPEQSGRWYSGGGLYRNLRLVTKPENHIMYNGVHIRQTYADKNQAVIDITIETVEAKGFSAVITDPAGNSFTYETNDNSLIFDIENPLLWDVDSPNLYTAVVSLPSGDSERVAFGVRVCEFTKNGFFLNGRYLKMNGVCMHHDLGSIGAAINVSALRRQIEILQGMGVNAIRTSHNPPAPELLDLCDEMGILVMDEFFDEWEIGKVKNGYSNYFNDYAVRDAIDIIKRDRNHPSVIMWSIGNEIKEQYETDGWKKAKMLYDAVHMTDPSRPVTQGFNSYTELFENHFVYYADILGLNYKPEMYAKIHKKYPEMLLLGAETESCISTRGVYHFPVKVCIAKNRIGEPCSDDLAVSAYELCAPRWAYYPERELAAQKDCPYVMGEFIWTGFDYLGEPTPYYTQWPSRSSYFGVVDMAGLPKNRYYCYRSAWTDIPTLHIFPHWTWQGREGQVTPVHIYTNYDEVELFVNGVSQGKRCRADAPDPELLPEIKAETGANVARFRLMWNDVVYQPGVITAVAYKDGKEAERKTVKTADTPHHIELSYYKETLIADGEDLNYITASIVDKKGNLCANAVDRLTFTVEGAAEFIATDAGDQRETEAFMRPDKKALGGMLVACIRATNDPGDIIVKCTGINLQEGKLRLKSI